MVLIDPQHLEQRSKSRFQLVSKSSCGGSCEQAVWRSLRMYPLSVAVDQKHKMFLFTSSLWLVVFRLLFLFRLPRLSCSPRPSCPRLLSGLSISHTLRLVRYFYSLLVSCRCSALFPISPSSSSCSRRPLVHRRPHLLLSSPLLVAHLPFSSSPPALSRSLLVRKSCRASFIPAVASFCALRTLHFVVALLSSRLAVHPEPRRRPSTMGNPAFWELLNRLQVTPKEADPQTWGPST